MNDTQLIKANGGVPPGQIIRTDFEGTQVENRAETASAAVAAREQAAVNARYLMAMRNPRDIEQFRTLLLKECRRPGFAELAEYERPAGREYNDATGQWEEKMARGPSIHLIRTAIALYRNVMADSATIYENAETRIVHAYVLDLETNVSWARSITISKVVERRGQKKKGGSATEPPKGRHIIAERDNSSGEKVYLVVATDDEIRNKEANLLAKAQRENGRSILPRDIIDEAIRVANSTLEKADAEDPDAAKRKVIDGFAEINVAPKDLEELVGHSLERLSPAELKELRRVFVAIREGNANWDEIIAAKDPAGSREAAKAVAEDKLANLRKGNAPAASAQPATEAQSVSGHVAALLQYKEQIGDAAFFKILGANGFESADQVPVGQWQSVAELLEQQLKDQRANPDQKATDAQRPLESAETVAKKGKGLDLRK